jgi:integrase
MRRGELLGLNWEDVDLGGSTISVPKTLTHTENGRRLAALGEPKTKKSRRTVSLTPQTVEALNLPRAREAEEKLKAGALYEDQGFVFAGEVENLINPYHPLSLPCDAPFSSLLRAVVVHTKEFDHGLCVLRAIHPPAHPARLGQRRMHRGSPLYYEFIAHLLGKREVCETRAVQVP